MIIYNENNTNNRYKHEITIRENCQYTLYIVQRTLITSNTKPGGPLSEYGPHIYTRVYRASWESGTLSGLGYQLYQFTVVVQDTVS